MFCSNCGNSLSKTDKFCSKCGKEVRDAKPDMPKHVFNLFKGLPTENKNYRAFYGDYLKRYEDSGFVLKGMPEDTRDFMLNHKYKEIVNTPLDESKISQLSEQKQKQFIKESIPVLDDLVVDLMIAGYLLRGNFQGINERTNFSELSGFKSPESVLKYLLSVDTPEMHMFGGDDTGFKIDPVLTGLAGVSIIDLVESNMHKEYPPSKALDKAALVIFLNIGWHLARFDIGRHR
jgi:hypothetical protein